MSEEQVVRNCAPTLAGLKTGNLFACPYESREDLLDFLRSLNRRLGKKGVRAVPLRIRQDKALIYLYRPARLEKDLSCASCEALLSACGYNCRGGSRCLTRLARKLKQQEDFPHEIGLFLSYPPEDVKGFWSTDPASAWAAGRFTKTRKRRERPLPSTRPAQGSTAVSLPAESTSNGSP